VALKLLNYYPLPNTPGQAITGVNNYAASPASTENNNLCDMRLDHNLSQSQRIFGRLSWNKTDQYAPGPFLNSIASPGAGDTIDSYWQGVVDYTNTISPTLVIDGHFGSARAHAYRLPAGFPVDYSQLGFNSAYNQAADGMFPVVAITGMASLASAAQRVSVRLQPDQASGTA
jgi:hypothetical protein